MAPASVVRGRRRSCSACSPSRRCSKSTSPAGGSAACPPVAPKPDPRVGLKAGMWDAAQAAWNVRLVSTTPPSEKFAGVTNSDLSFLRNYAIQGNYNGFQVWDVSNPAKPTLTLGFLCPASQSDVSVYKNLLFVSGEGNSGRIDCGAQGVQRHGERRPPPRHPDLRRHRHREPEVHRERADLPRLAHPHGGGRPEGRGERLHLRVGLGGRPVAERAARLLQARPGQGPELGAVPHRGDQGAAGAPGAGGDRELAAHLPGPGGAAGARRDTRTTSPSRRRRPPRPARRAATRPRSRARSTSCRRSSSTRCSTASRRRTAAPTPNAADSAALRTALPAMIAARFGPPPDPGRGPSRPDPVP